MAVKRRSRQSRRRTRPSNRVRRREQKCAYGSVQVGRVGAEKRESSMINYTEHVRQLMSDIVQRVPRLSFLDMNRILVFARSGRADREGPYATCHCVCLPPSDPGYYFWRDQTTGALTRRSEWFVTKSPSRACVREPDRLHGVVHAAAILRSAAHQRQQTRAVCRPSPVDGKARHHHP